MIALVASVEATATTVFVFLCLEDYFLLHKTSICVNKVQKTTSPSLPSLSMYHTQNEMVSGNQRVLHTVHLKASYLSNFPCRQRYPTPGTHI